MTTRIFCELFGASLILGGLALAYLPLAIIALGALILGICYLTEGAAE